MKWMIRLLGMALLAASLPGAASLGLYDRSEKFTISYTLVRSIAVQVLSSVFVAGIFRRRDVETGIEDFIKG
jgi:hypothetical protein